MPVARGCWLLEVVEPQRSPQAGARLAVQLAQQLAQLAYRSDWPWHHDGASNAGRFGPERFGNQRFGNQR